MADIDEDFLKEMLEHAKDYHIRNGCDEKLANSLGLLNIYRLRALHCQRDCEANFSIRFDLRKLISENSDFKWELISGLFHSLETLIDDLEAKRPKQDPDVYVNVYNEDGIAVFHLDSD